MGYHDAVADFIRAMEMEGIKPVEPIASRLATGELIRFRCDGDGKGRQNGWAILYADERPAGAFGNYRLGVARKWRSDNHVELSPAERAALHREWEAAKQRKREEREASEEEAARDAAEIWGNAQPATAAHAYIAKKVMDPTPFRVRGPSLLFPMYDHHGKLWNLQRVSPDGEKRFLRGGRTDGLFFLFGEFTRRGETVCIGEGVATMAAVHAASGYPCIASFSAKNLATVARIWWNARPDLDFVICADDDAHLERNIGMDAARSIADEIGAKVATPTREAA